MHVHTYSGLNYILKYMSGHACICVNRVPVLVHSTYYYIDCSHLHDISSMHSFVVYLVLSRASTLPETVVLAYAKHFLAVIVTPFDDVFARGALSTTAQAAFEFVFTVIQARCEHVEHVAVRECQLNQGKLYDEENQNRYFSAVFHCPVIRR